MTGLTYREIEEKTGVNQREIRDILKGSTSDPGTDTVESDVVAEAYLGGAGEASSDGDFWKAIEICPRYGAELEGTPRGHPGCMDCFETYGVYFLPPRLKIPPSHAGCEICVQGTAPIGPEGRQAMLQAEREIDEEKES